MSLLDPKKSYSGGVLMGNWYEDQYKFIPHKSSWLTNYNDEYVRHNVCATKRAGEITRRHNWARLDLSKTELSFSDPGCRNVSTYDQEINYHEGIPPQSTYPRKLCLREMKWKPERMDLPLRCCPRNWGLLNKVESRMKEINIDYWKGDYETTYNNDYNRKHPKEGQQVHPKIRMDGRQFGNRLKHQYNYANQWYTFMTDKCTKKFDVLPPTQKTMKMFDKLGPSEPEKKTDPKYMNPKDFVSSAKYHVEPSCSCPCRQKRCNLTMW